VTQNDTYYEGPSGCNGLCGSAKTGEFLTETLDIQDPSVVFSLYDNDGADGLPDSGDDDGYVDFVHPEFGGECGGDNIWSHRWVINGWVGGADYVTDDPANSGGNIRISDYVIMPGLACDGTTMIQIGVFAHEFGHAFGLPDLYDTDASNGDSEGIGHWGVMGSGGWNTPASPGHFSAWSKEFLGWISPVDLTVNAGNVQIPNVEQNAVAYRLDISSTEYHLIANRQPLGFDVNLHGPGLAVWHINQAVIDSGMFSNSVNADENNKGVDLEEAEGISDLDGLINRGDAADVFQGRRPIPSSRALALPPARARRQFAASHIWPESSPQI
jgi:M6 family metalloprotease-like protein